MKKSTLIVGMMLLYFGLSAQQDPQFTQWMFDKVSFNPAATGANDAHCVSLFYRDQWDQLENDPKTAMFNYNGLFGGNIGVGIVASDDRLGQMKNTTIKLNGAYHHDLGAPGIISGGLSVSVYGMTLGDDWRPTEVGDPTVPIATTASSVTDFGFGAMLRNTDYYVGISSTHLNESQMDLVLADFNVIRHYYVMGGYNFDVNSDIKLRSNVLVKSDINATIFDVNVNALWKDMIWAGVSYRLNDAVAPMAGFQYNLTQINNGKFIWDHKIMLGYSYDATLSELNTVSTGSHEIFLTYCFNIQEIIIKKLYSNPRFL